MAIARLRWTTPSPPPLSDLSLSLFLSPPLPPFFSCAHTLSFSLSPSLPPSFSLVCSLSLCVCRCCGRRTTTFTMSVCEKSSRPCRNWIYRSGQHVTARRLRGCETERGETGASEPARARERERKMESERARERERERSRDAESVSRLRVRRKCSMQTAVNWS